MFHAANLRARNWCFTINFNYEADPSCPPYELFPEDWLTCHINIITFCCWQMEIGESGHEHLQGYLECVGKQSMRQILTLPGFDTQSLGYSVHLETRRGTQAQAIAYCSKVDGTEVPGTYVEWGVRKAQGNRADLDDIREAIIQGASLKRIADENFSHFVRYHRAFSSYKQMHTPHRTERTLVLVLWGPTGCGKSRLARELFPDAMWKTNDNWFYEYEQEEAVIFDEFKGQYPFRDMLRMLDSTPLSVQSKGGHVRFNSKIVIITSNFHPSEWYNPENTGGFTWTNNPLNRRLREYGQIMYMGPRTIDGFCPSEYCCITPHQLGYHPLFGGRADHVVSNSSNFVPASIPRNDMFDPNFLRRIE